MLASKEDAEDVLQEVFAAAYNAMLADNRAINVRPWLYRIARNRCLNHLRRAQPIGVDSMDIHFAEGGRRTARQGPQARGVPPAPRGRPALPETQRTALLLREIDALSYDQIAEAMETTVPSVKSLLVRARVSLAEAAEARRMTCDEVRLELGEVAEGLSEDHAARPAPPQATATAARVPQAAAQTNNRALAAVLPVGPLLLLKKLLLAQPRHDRRRRRPRRAPRAAPPPAAARAARPAGVGASAPSPARPPPVWPPRRSSRPAPSRSGTSSTRRRRRAPTRPRPAARPAPVPHRVGRRVQPVATKAATEARDQGGRRRDHQAARRHAAPARSDPAADSDVPVLPDHRRRSTTRPPTPPPAPERPPLRQPAPPTDGSTPTEDPAAPPPDPTTEPPTDDPTAAPPPESGTETPPSDDGSAHLPRRRRRSRRHRVIEFDAFAEVDMRVGRVVAVEDFPEARKPAWKLTIDFGPEMGIKKSSAQITHYPREELEGRLVVGVVNLPPRQIGPVRSEVLVLGALDHEKGVILLAPDQDVALGSRIG